LCTNSTAAAGLTSRRSPPVEIDDKLPQGREAVASDNQQNAQPAPAVELGKVTFA